ncbi:MAG: ATP-binding protein [Planctomycetota bacterium]|nr:ATP-binding protein [Planctomycetota bacterium]
MPRPVDTWMDIGPRAKSSQKASFQLRAAFNDRLGNLFVEYQEALSKLPKRKRSDLSVQEEIFTRYATTFRLQLEQHIIAMDQALKDEIKSRISVEGENRLAATLNRLGSALIQDWPFNDLLRLICEECTELLSTASTIVFVVDPGGELNRHKDLETVQFANSDVVLDPIVREVLASKEHQILEDPVGEAAMGMKKSLGGSREIQNLVAFPITIGETVLGIIVCINKKNGFSKEDTSILTRVASHAGTVFHKHMMQKEVLRTRQFYADLVASAGQAIVSLSQGKLTSWNDGARKIFGHNLDDVLLKPLDLILAPAEREGISRNLEEIYRTGLTQSFEAEGVRSDGGPIDLMVTLSPLKGHQQVVGIITDMSDQKRLQVQLIQAEKMAAVGQLISGVAHELNNPLASVIGYAELLGEEADLDPDHTRDAKMILTNAMRCKGIVSKLLRFSRKESTRFLAFDLSEAVRDSVALREREMSLRNITVSLEAESGPLTVLGSPGQMQQVFLNILNNAYDAVLEKDEAGSIRIVVDRTDRMGIVTIHDTGRGIPSDHVSEVFDPFYTTKRPGQGTGLGLSVSYRIVQNHSGQITVSSEEGKGTTFRVEIPLYEVGIQDGSSGLPENEAAGGLRDKEILVVEDEEDIGKLLERILTKEGAKVTVAGGPREALKMTEERRADLIITDVIMPGEMDGFDLFSELLHQWPELDGRILFMSGGTMNKGMLERLDQLGAQFVPKPFDRADLLEAVNGCLSADAPARPDVAGIPPR